MERSYANLLEVYRNYQDSDIDGVMYGTKPAMLYFNAMPYPRHLSFAKGHLSSNYGVFYFPKKSILRDLFNHRKRDERHANMCYNVSYRFRCFLFRSGERDI